MSRQVIRHRPTSRACRLAWRFLQGNAVVLFALACATLLAATPLYEQDPYDQITLNAANDNAVLKITPLELPNRQPPDPAKSHGKLVVCLLDKPDRKFEVAWNSIAKVELFEQLILNKANELVAAGKFDEAYDYFLFLERNRPQTPGLGKAVEDYIYEEAKWAQRDKKYDSALALLHELYRRNPKRPKLDRALGRTTDLMVEQYVEKQNYAAARALLRNLDVLSPRHPLVIQWNDRFKDRVAPLMTEARAAVDAGQLGKATSLCRQIMEIWPDLPGARELARRVHRKYPRVVVGVDTLATSIVPGRIDDWAGRRTSRLVYRTLTEFVGPSPEGGKYNCPVGKISSEALGRRLVIQLRPNIRWAVGPETLGNADVSRQLLAMADPRSNTYRVEWSDILKTVSLRNAYEVVVELRQAHVRPEGMLQIVLTPYTASVKPGESLPANGPFVVQSQTPEETVFRANAQYFAAEANQPKELVERRYAKPEQAVRALKKGEIQVIDRVSPWRLASLRENPQLIVEPYALPLIHCLIPNPRRPLLRDRTFRRALAYGIQRQAILQQMLGGVEIPGCVITSSPFPVGIGSGDPMSYASDDGIAPRPYEPRLTITLANLAIQSYSASHKKDGKALKAVPELVLAYPKNEIAHAACASIQKQLKYLEIPVKLRPFEGPPPARIPDDVDLLYAELAMWEPVIDARRLLGEDGIAGGCSSYMSLALRQLDEAAEWIQVRDCLHRVHRIAHEDVAVIPLWQLVEHFAYRKNFQGGAAKPVSLYQNVEQWRPTFQHPSEK